MCPLHSSLAETSHSSLVRSATTSLAVSIVFSLGLLLPGAILAQPPSTSSKPSTANSNVIRPENYTASDFMADGQTSQAMEVLATGLSQTRMVNNQRGIDSIPLIVKMGECFLEQCDIGMALEKYDSALQIAIDAKGWTVLLKSAAGSVRADPRAREVPWAMNGRATQMGGFTEAWPISLGSNDTLLEFSKGQGPVGKTISIDAIEVLRCQAIALRRRFQLLGSLAKHSPLSKPLLDAFTINTVGQNEIVHCSIEICRALAMIGLGERAVASKLLIQNLSLANGLDHPLTSIALLAIADLAVESNELLVAEERAIEASIVAGRAGQLDHLSEAIEYLSEIGFADGHDIAIGKMLQQIVAWSSTKSRMVAIRGQVEWARLSALVGDIEGAKKHCNAATTMLLPKQVVMPRAEAVIRYSLAKVAFLEGNVSEGISTFYESVAFLRGSGSGIGSPPLFQLDMALHLTKSNHLPDAVAEAILTQLLNPPATGHWRVQPLEQLLWLMADKTEVVEQLLAIQLRTRRDAELVTSIDDAIRRRYRRIGELESRVFDLQMIFHGDSRFLNTVSSGEAKQLRKQFPALDQNATKIVELLAPLLANPKWDTRKWSEEETRRWDSAVRLSAVQESMFWAAAIGPVVISEIFPPRHSQQGLDKALQTGDAVLLFASIGKSLRGYLLTAGKWRSWEILEANAASLKVSKIRSEWQGLEQPPRSKPNLGNASKPKIIELVSLRDQLFPKEIWAELNGAERWIVVPDQWIWNVPFELLPMSDAPNALPCIAGHRITYSPTLGLVPYLLQAKLADQLKHPVDVHVGEFVAPDSTRKHAIVDLIGKGGQYPSSRFFKLASDRICTFASMNWDSIAPVPSDSNPALSGIPAWGHLPWGSPTSLLLPGVQSQPPSVASKDRDNEWLQLTLPLIAQGTQHMTVSRWPVGGESTSILFRSFQDNMIDLPVSEAWQRSVLSLWEEQFDPRSEPLFHASPNLGADQKLPGNHPLLWSGYIRIGDSK